MILLIDNYDSFVFNLARYVRELGEETVVRRHDATSHEEIERLRPSHIIISPGPCAPGDAGISTDVVRRFGPTIPILGVCLGHQCIGAAYGAGIVRAGRPVHGKAARIQHDGRGLFAGLPTPFLAARYHSLVIARAGLPADLRVTATADDGEIVIKPFLETTTFRNLEATGAAVVNLTDDAMLFARGAISNVEFPARPAAVVPGVVLEAACSWREVRVHALDATPPRARIVTRVVHHGVQREFLGFNRARHAVLEAAILATRIHLLPPEQIRDEFARLQVIVDKTAGPRERDATALLSDYVRRAPRPEQSAAR